ncbi:MAG: hypothetical protein IJD62_03665 [Oscillospiraceae bacterium]|nr:hypothetical protein [Oscillospiraceae bacterium]
MKRFFTAVMAFVMVFAFSGCGMPIMAKKIVSYSELFTEKEIDRAMMEVYKEFAFFEGCVLLEIEYDEKYSKERAADWAENYGYDEGMVLLSKFYVAGDNPSLAKGETYSKWNWVLVRNKGKAWELKTWGYG